MAEGQEGLNPLTTSVALWSPVSHMNYENTNHATWMIVWANQSYRQENILASSFSSKRDKLVIGGSC